MSREPQRMAYTSMGTQWVVSVWDDINAATFAELETLILRETRAFEQTYSRFLETSLIWSLVKQLGRVEVPADLVDMLRIYAKLFDLSKGKCNPLVGFSLSDMGYDAQYSLVPKERIRRVPDFHSALTIIDDTHIDLRESVLIDLGAVGKGYFVDKIATMLTQRGIKQFLVDGSGDMYYHGNGNAIRVGLEHPGDTTKAIGVVELSDGALCGSASNRRRWNKYHHTIDPMSLTSPEGILSTWVMAETAALADGLATCLFLTDPQLYEKAYRFDYCILSSQLTVKRSSGFVAELF